MCKYIPAVFLLLLIGSCKKSSTDVDDIPPSIISVEPTANKTYSSLTGDCHIEFSTADNAGLDGVVVNIVNYSGINFYTNSIKISGKEYDFHDHFTAAGITSTTSFTIKMEVIDKAGNKLTKSIPFFLKP